MYDLHVPLQRVPINNFRGGLNTRDSPFELQPNESPDLQNVTLTSLVGQLIVRKGSTPLQTNAGTVLSLPTYADNMTQTVIGANRYLMMSISGKIYSWDPVAGLVLRFTGGPGTIWSFAQWPDATGADRIWCSNGVDTPQKWDGVTAATSVWAGSPPNGKSILVWRDRLVVAGVAAHLQTIYLSPVDDPESTTGSYAFLILTGPEDEAAAITELNVLADRLYVFKQRSVFLVTDPASLSNRRIGEPGCYSRFQSAVLGEKLYFFNEQGIWSTGGVVIAAESGSIDSWFPDNMDFSRLAQARLMATSDVYPRILVTAPVTPSGSTLIELLPSMNFRRIGGRRYLLLPAFMIHTFNVTSFCNYKFNNIWQVIGSDATAPMYYGLQMFVGDYDYTGTPYQSLVAAHWKSSWIAIQGEEPFERIRRLNIELSGTATVDVYKDFTESPDFTSDLPLIETGGIYDSPYWDDGFWDGGQWDSVLASAYRFVRVRPESRGRFHQIQIRTMSGTPPPGYPIGFQINTLELAVRGGKEH